MTSTEIQAAGEITKGFPSSGSTDRTPASEIEYVPSIVMSLALTLLNLNFIQMSMPPRRGRGTALDAFPVVVPPHVVINEPQ